MFLSKSTVPYPKVPSEFRTLPVAHGRTGFRSRFLVPFAVHSLWRRDCPTLDAIGKKYKIDLTHCISSSHVPISLPSLDISISAGPSESAVEDARVRKVHLSSAPATSSSGRPQLSYTLSTLPRRPLLARSGHDFLVLLAQAQSLPNNGPSCPTSYTP